MQEKISKKIFKKCLTSLKGRFIMAVSGEDTKENDEHQVTEKHHEIEEDQADRLSRCSAHHIPKHHKQDARKDGLHEHGDRKDKGSAESHR